jgi:hypothetical protein
MRLFYVYAFPINVVESINYPQESTSYVPKCLSFSLPDHCMIIHCLVTQFLNRNGIECNDLEELFIKDQSLSNESEYFGFGFFTFFLKNINLNPCYSNLS